MRVTQGEGAAGQVWAKELVKRVGKTMKAARGAKSAVWLSDRTAELGYRVPATVIAKLDSGHRGAVLSVAELIVLAAALNTSPVTLIYPGPYGEKTELLPGKSVHGFGAAQWFSALEWLDILTLPDDRTHTRKDTLRAAREDWQVSTGTINSWRSLGELESEQAAIIERGDFERDQKQIELYDKLIRDMRRTLGIGSDA